MRGPADSVTLRPAYPVTPAEAEGIYSVWLSAMREVVARHYGPEVIAKWTAGRSPAEYREAEEAGERYILAERTGGIVGFASWTPGVLAGLYVSPDHQGHGIGTQLFRECERQAGAPLTRVAASLNAVTFYEGLGFRVLRDSVMTRPGAELPIADMERTIA